MMTYGHDIAQLVDRVSAEILDPTAAGSDQVNGLVAGVVAARFRHSWLAVLDCCGRSDRLSELIQRDQLCAKPRRWWVDVCRLNGSAPLG